MAFYEIIYENPKKVGPTMTDEVREFKIGDVVRLKSGGPDMTIQDVTEYEIKCRWFDAKKKFFDSSFQPEELVDASAPQINVKFVSPP